MPVPEAESAVGGVARTMIDDPEREVVVARVLDGRYVVRGVLGRGGKSIVYEAEDRLLSRKVAVKVFTERAETVETLREQQTEAQVVASLNHYALTTLFDAGVDATDRVRPQLFLVMELVPGSDLKAQLRLGAMLWQQVCYLGYDLTEGLEYLHESGFLHRDIKPANVLLAMRQIGNRPRAKLTDFGIASLIGVPEGGEFVTGTAAYLSPEQVEGADPTAASDVYSLGLVLIEALTGRVAYPGGVEESAFARLDHDPVLPADVPDGLTRLLRSMTARAPASRPTPQDAAARFQDLLVDELVRRRGDQARATAEAEAARITALRRYNVLDTPPEEAFDRVTRLAGRLLDAPIALISIIDTDRVFLKSRQGFDEEVVDRNTSFCATTNPGTGAAWTIPDALKDPRTATNPVVLGDPEVRSYAAAPLTTSDGYMLGSLCVYDLHPRDFDAAALQTLTELADIVMDELEIRLASRRALFDR